VHSIDTSRVLYNLYTPRTTYSLRTVHSSDVLLFCPLYVNATHTPCALYVECTHFCVHSMTLFAHSYAISFLKVQVTYCAHSTYTLQSSTPSMYTLLYSLYFHVNLTHTLHTINAHSIQPLFFVLYELNILMCVPRTPSVLVTLCVYPMYYIHTL
jgi:hypothetical protein